MPTKRDVRREMDKALESNPIRIKEKHAITRAIFEAMGEAWDIRNMNPTTFDIVLNREYEIATREWFDEAVKPVNVHLLSPDEVMQIEG